MNLLKKIKEDHFLGEGGIAAIIPIAVPMIISNGFDTAMMFIDRLFVSRIGEGCMAACMNGGLLVFTLTAFFVGMLSYVGTLVAHSWGGKSYTHCSRIVSQGLWLSVIVLPIITMIGFIICNNLEIFNFAKEQEIAQRVYVSTLLYFVFFSLIRSVFAGFFIGIGRTWIILIANFVALIVNVVVNYLLIFGNYGFPKLGMKGAAIGTGISTIVLVLILIAFYVYTLRKEACFVGSKLLVKFDSFLFKKLFHLGAPCGAELFLNMASFSLCITIFHSYGLVVAEAITIVFNWDLIAFIPMIGLQTGITAMVGQFMGAKKPDLAERATYSGFKLALFYGGIMLTLFVFCSSFLVNFFNPSPAVEELAFIMIRMAALYLLFDGMLLVFTGALRGAGDTRWVMMWNVGLHWLMVLFVFLSTKIWGFPYLCDLAENYKYIKPIFSWLFFIFMILSCGTLFLMRFRRGKWKSLEIKLHETGYREGVNCES